MVAIGMFVATVIAAPAASVRCTVKGTNADDVLEGTAAADIICGLKGNDTIRGLGGDDVLYGDEGDDILEGGAGGDRLHGGPGEDRVSYAASSAAVTAFLGRVDGSDGAGSYSSGNGAAGEHDRIYADVEDLTGGAGGDSLTGSDAANTLSGGGGGDVIRGRGGADAISGDGGNDELRGDDGDDTFATGPSADGADVFFGGGGFDVVSYAPRRLPIVATLNGGADDGADGEGDDLGDVEGVTGGMSDDRLTGSPRAEHLVGQGGADLIDPAGGGDSVYAGAGEDTIRARDALADAVIDCGSGDDRANVDAADSPAGCEIVTRTPVVGLALALSDTPDPIRTTQAVTYRASVQNAGPDTATRVQVRFLLPADGSTAALPENCAAGTPVVCALASIEPGATGVQELAIRYASTGVKEVRAQASAAALDYDASDDAATETTTVTPPLADLSAGLAAGAASVQEGQPVTFTATIANHGPDTAGGASATFAGLPGGTGAAGCAQRGDVLVCSLGDIASGATVTKTVTATWADAGTRRVTVTANSATADPIARNDAAAATVEVTPGERADLAVDVSGPASLLQNETGSFVARATNAGPQTALEVRVRLVVPDGWGTFMSPSGCQSDFPGDGSVVLTCTAASVAAGGSVQWTVNVPFTAPGDYAMPASVSSATTDPDPTNDADSHAFTVVERQADVAVDVSGPSSLLQGENGTFVAKATNAGPQTAGVTVKLTVPDGWGTFSVPSGCQSDFPGDGSVALTCTASSVAAGQSAQWTLNLPFNKPGDQAMPATVSSSLKDPHPADNADSHAFTVVERQADVAVDVSGPSSLLQGETGSFVVKATNAGPQTAFGVKVKLTVPDGWGIFSAPDGCQSSLPGDGTVVLTCTASSLPSGQSAQWTVNVPFTVPGDYSMPATVSSSPKDPDTTDNSDAHAFTVVERQADVALDVSGPATLLQHETGSFVAKATNAGPQTAFGVTVKLTVPNGWNTFTVPSGCQSAFPGDGSVLLTCTASSLPSGQSAQWTVNVPFTEVGDHAMPASVSSSPKDPDTTDNADTHHFTVRSRVADLSVDLTGPGATLRSFSGNYVVTVNNTGPDPVLGAQARVTFPRGHSNVTAPAGCFVQTQVDGSALVTCNVGALANGASWQRTIPVTYGVAGSYTAVATVSSTADDPDGADNTESHAFTIL